jgi:hypothetical protein
MTNFDPQGDFKDIEHWELIAERKASNTGMAAKIIGGVLAGGAGIAFGVELLGGIAAVWCIKSAWDASKNIGKRLRLVRDCGCNAFLLDEDQFRTYVKQFGEESVIQELSFALEAGAELSSFALNWLRTCNKGLAPQQEQMALTQGVALGVQQPVLSVPTKIGSAPKPFVQTRVDVWNSTEDEEVDIVSEMTDRISNLFIVGLGGSGKGMLLANALREVKRKHPDKKIFLVNGKVDPKESGYFEGIVDVEKPLHCESAKPQTVAAWFEAAMADYDAFAVEHNGALLVIDEGTIIGARLKTAKCTALTDKLIGITSCGGSSGKNVWFVAQTPFVGANGSDTSGISQLTPIVLVTSNNLSVVDSWKRASLFKKFDTEEIGDLVNKSDCNRAVYFGKTAQWYSMQKLTNYSAFDRDKGKFIGDVKVADIQNQDTVIQSTISQVKLSENAQKVLDWLENKEPGQWFYYRSSEDNKRDNAFAMMLSRLGLLNNESALSDVFLELHETENIDISDDGLGIKLL